MRKDLPKNIWELLGGDHSDFRLAIGHYVELDHTLMGTFPAIERDSREMVLTTDFGLMREVCEMLTPRRSKFGTQLLYVNSEGVAYSVLGIDEDSLKRGEPFQIMTRPRFNELKVASEKPFQWAPGLVGNDMNADEFREALEAAAKHHAEA
jgi:hypothetical protein